MKSKSSVRIRTLVTGGNVDGTEQQAIVNAQVTAHKEELAEECLSFLNENGPAIVNVFLEPDVDEGSALLGILSPTYDLELDSLLSQFYDWWRDSKFNPLYDKVVVVVPKESQTKGILDATADVLFSVTNSRAVFSTSLEQWVRECMNRKVSLKNF